MAHKLLIVEDDSLLTEELKVLFEKAGYSVDTAIDGETGLQKALDTKPDAILLDIVVPKLNGVDFLVKLTADAWGKQIPVLVLTNMDNQMHLSKVLELGSYDYFVKTEHSLEDILEKVEQRINKT